VFSRYYMAHMSTVKTWQTISADSETTEALAEKIGKRLKGGEAIELVSDLGGGKTTFVRGLARGAGSDDKVASPTFTISKVYKADKFEIHHFDFYRLPDPGIVADELAELVHDPKVVIVVEWGDSVQHVLPEDRLTVRLAQTPEGARTLDMSVSESLGYLLEAIQ
jgi:tRNA threonylcarbamoyladenosine biosynthesis protein TsaE